ncbi:hypothetical protein K443DRAFT_317979 [Laccaria amethystina LaAM-08-1]|uniref:Uncharacterized protein n=1 Tax=Laccaria amethystina LaAM-08-1 TaxID=1095629 RepID=A0A0C9X1F1_9AGAR|nr:hypothetical protein K443DRAFT_317979 [Laccaria amethystina LaAM-08-1]
MMRLVRVHKVTMIICDKDMRKTCTARTCSEAACACPGFCCRCCHFFAWNCTSIFHKRHSLPAHNGFCSVGIAAVIRLAPYDKQSFASGGMVRLKLIRRSST